MIQEIISKIEVVFTSFTAWIQNISNGSDWIAGGITLWILGFGSYMLRAVPGKIYKIIKKQVTTELTIDNHNKCFYEILTWLDKKGYTKKFRTIKINNGKWGDDNLIKSIGEGNHYIFYQYQPIKITLLSESKVGTNKIIEKITFSKPGRSHSVFEKIIKEASIENKKQNSIDIFNFRQDHWQKVANQPIRSFDSIFIEQHKKQTILNTLDNFIQSENWYLENGIPYQLGILLYGPPGTGKTSIIKAISSYLNRNVYFTNSLANIRDMVADIDNTSLLVIEDIDSSLSAQNREDSEDNLLNKLVSTESLSEVLNSIDGFMSKHGRILVATTNHLEKLDPALIRPGRFDIKIEIGYLTPETFTGFLRKFFNNVPHIINIKQEVTGAMLQQDILNKLSLEKIIYKYMK